VSPPSPIDRVASSLVVVGTVSRVLAVLTLLTVFALVKLAPDLDTFGLGGLLLAFIGAAVSPGWGLPMLLTGRLRARAGLLGALRGQRGATAPVASGAGIRALGLVLTLAGGAALVLGVGLAASGLPRLLG
jgi:hypothetical protein